MPGSNAIPERRPTITDAGNLSLKKFTKSETADLYMALVCGHVLVTVKEAFASAPALDSSRVLAMRATSPDAYGRVGFEVLLAARFEKTRLNGIRWTEADATRIVNDASSERILVQKGAARELAPIDLTTEPQLAEVVRAGGFRGLA